MRWIFAILLLSTAQMFAQGGMPSGSSQCTHAVPKGLECVGEGTDFVGMVVQVEGKDCFTQAPGKQPARVGSTKKVFAGSAVQCQCSSSLTMRLLTGAEQTTCMSLRASDGCYRVESLSDHPAGAPEPKIPTTPCQTSKADAELLVKYGDPAGPARGETGPIFSPAFAGSVRPEQLTIRWTPQQGAQQVRFSVHDEDGNIVWPPRGTSDGEVDAAKAELVSASARKALSDFRSGGGQGILELRMDDSAGHTYRVPFSILSNHSEEVMGQQLQQCAKSEMKELLNLCRAAVFGKFKLFPEMADEYDQALRLVPDSEDLLQNAIQVNQRTGNSKRVQELTTLAE